MLRIVLLIAVAIALGGCNLVHKQNIQQGNVLDDEDLEQLTTGMTKRQVLFLLGSPSVQSPFHADRWDYVSTFAPRGRNPTKRRLTLEFEDDRLVAFHGNYLDEGQIEGSVEVADPEDLEDPPEIELQPSAQPEPPDPIPTPPGQ